MFTVSCSFTVTVTDTEAPTINCPDDILVTLGPGDCSEIINYEVTGSDNCPFIVPGNSLFTDDAGAPGNFFNAFAGVTFDLRNDGTDPIIIDGFKVPVTGAIGNSLNFNVYYTTTATTNNGVQVLHQDRSGIKERKKKKKTKIELC